MENLKNYLLPDLHSFCNKLINRGNLRDLFTVFQSGSLENENVPGIWAVRIADFARLSGYRER
jgi:hypothetical protein